MTDANIIKKATNLAEKEIEEKEIERVKNIVKDYLKEIKEKESKYQTLGKELSLLKKDLDDFKAGRLDKIVERQKIEPLSPKIIIIKTIEKEFYPLKPWYNHYDIVYPYPFHSFSTANVPFCQTNTTLLGGVGTAYCTSATSLAGEVSTLSANPLLGNFEIMGNTFKNFSQGAYEIGGKIINL